MPDSPQLDRLVYAMDNTAWTSRRAADGVAVHSGYPCFSVDEPPSRVEGFYIAAERDDVTVEHGLAYFHDACHFADTANRMTTASGILRVDDARLAAYHAIVRTGFALPWPLQDREFLHSVATRRDTDPEGRDRALIVYASVSEAGLAPAWEGYLRCPMEASGQRVTALGNGRVRLEHCMTYTLGGWVPEWAQNHLFHRGHVGAYHQEWVAAMDTLATEVAAGPALATGRGVRAE